MRVILAWYFLTLSIRLGFAQIQPVPSRVSLATDNLLKNSDLLVERNMAIGGSLYLNADEQKADAIIQQYKMNEVNAGFADPSTYAPGMHFFQAIDIINESPIYKILKIMPKGFKEPLKFFGDVSKLSFCYITGGALHVHNSAMTSSEWVIKNLTYNPLLMICVNSANVTILSFRQASWHGCSSYDYVVQQRANSGDPVAYDEQLETLINLYTPTPEIDYPNINAVWARFQNMFATCDLFTYVDAFVAYMTQAMQEFYDDGVLYIEFRTSFSALYTLDGYQYTKLETFRLFSKIVNDFKAKNPNFYDAKFIFSPQRGSGVAAVNASLMTYKDLYAADPNMNVGFDLVGQEDLGQALPVYVDVIKNNLPYGARLFFHAGETDWFGTSVDYNLIDALKMGTTRIGHGYAAMKHPQVWSYIKNNNVAIEVCPISNQVLHLVWDLRNHPATFFYSENIPMVISSDDPGYWNAKGLSYDFYYALMSIAPADIGLTYLKQLALNSINYSALSYTDKSNLTNIFNNLWKAFIANVINGNY